MKIINTRIQGVKAAEEYLSPKYSESAGRISDTVRGIISDVRERGDAALLELGQRFDSPLLQSVKVSDGEIEAAYGQIDAGLLEAIRQAIKNVGDFHAMQKQKSWIDVKDGVIYGQTVTPIDCVGFYAPGGLAPYPSTVIMCAVPGMIAGVRRMLMTTPAQKDTGTIHPAMLVAAAECGVRDIFKIGGAQAIAAMAFGTGTVPRADKIVGPGNAFVAEAKRQLFGYVGIDQIAGPSEILILCDDSADPEYVAADMLSQAEHAEDSRCAVVTTSERIFDRLPAVLERQTGGALREKMIRASLGSAGALILCADMDEGVRLANVFAPEHLELQTESPWDTLKGIKNAGAIMIGHHTPVPVCDFAAGPNHTLPTSGTSRFTSALSVDEYVKKSGILSFNEKGLKEVAPAALALAECEGFEAHANTIKIRTGDK
ncbi:MAG: histidinol dehydrogenase [Abditibacteriota bacterium]|nr:histidinol dehydrogenase [Abditibacteriota bacterium]